MDSVAAIREASARFYDAVNQVQRGDPAPMLALWSRGADVTQLGPHGGRQEGRAAIEAYFMHAAALAARSPAAVLATPGDLLIQVRGDLGYTCGSEQVEVTREGQTTRFSARATNIYRREDDGWKLLHRHADAVTPP